ncbi:MAG: S8 family serine peptidase [Deinococcota bacterium]|nr:S8 family serine peptidase [Deinococcota bacterium]
MRKFASFYLALSLLLTACPGPGGGEPPPDFSLELSPPSLAVARGGSAAVTVVLSRTGGFGSDVAVSLASPPAGVSAPPVIVAGGSASATLTLTAGEGAAPGQHSLTVVGSSGGLSDSATLSLTVEAAGATSISGTVGVAGTGSSSLVRALANLSRATGAEVSAESAFVPGEVIVRFGSLSAQSLSSLSVNGLELQRVRPLAFASAQLYRTTGLDEEETLELVRALNARDDVLYAQPNYLWRPFKTPNDEFYPLQWHYPAINLPAAWDVTTGVGTGAGTVVAVLDSGILYREGAAASHPDLAGKVLPGYDFISDPKNAADGDGRDADPYDPGPAALTGYHGSHVAGTIAAATDNGLGGAGVDWSARILPVRVLGLEGGTTVDIMEGLLWAAGLGVAGVPENANPAAVLNLSLGGPGRCGAFEQEAFNQVLARGAVVVVAAGNENADAGGFYPANCSGVVTVGATDYLGQRAHYSNYGERIDVMAPGGDVRVDLSGDGFPDGVLSLGFDDSSGEFGYSFSQGTSMAAPHVAGVAALMKGLEPTLTAAEILSVLKVMARPLTGNACAGHPPAFCGAGLIDAHAAVTAVSSGPPPAEGLVFNPDPLDFAASSEELALTLTNRSGSSLGWEIVGYEPAAGNPGDVLDGVLYLGEGAPASGSLPAGGSVSTVVGVDRSQAAADGSYRLDLVVGTGAEEFRLPVLFRKGSAPPAGPLGPMVVVAFQEAGGDFVLTGFQGSQGVITSYTLAVPPGEHYVVAWSDENDNDEIDAGDYYGEYPETVAAVPGQGVSDIDFAISRLVSAPSSGLSFDLSFDPSFDRGWLERLKRQ